MKRMLKNELASIDLRLATLYENLKYAEVDDRQPLLDDIADLIEQRAKVFEEFETCKADEE